MTTYSTAYMLRAYDNGLSNTLLKAAGAALSAQFHAYQLAILRATADHFPPKPTSIEIHLSFDGLAMQVMRMHSLIELDPLLISTRLV